jgi:hypothetical protein
VSREADRELVLHLPPWICGLSTILDGSTLPWIDELRDKGELHTHQGAQHDNLARDCRAGFDRVDLLKIDVEGHFMEVLEGIAAADTAKLSNIVLEAEYVEALGLSGDSMCAMLRDKGYNVEAQDAAQIMIYARRA